MSGQIRVRNCYISRPTAASEPGRDGAQSFFTALYRYLKYLETVGVTTEIARHGGQSGGASNVNFWDQTNPFLCNAWAVFRFNANAGRTWPWYYLIQWSKGNVSNFGNSPGSPGLFDGGQGNYSSNVVACQAAIGVGGDQNPWNGGGSMGTSTKGNPVWKVPAGGSDVLVFPRSNSTGGSHTASRQNCTRLWYTDDHNTPWGHTINFVSDDDSLLICYQSVGSNIPNGLTSYYSCYTGLYTPISGLAPTYPFCQWGDNNGPWRPYNQATGPTSGAYPGGGAYAPGATPGVRQVGWAHHDEAWWNAPNTFRAGGRGYDVIPVMMVVTESGLTGMLGVPQLLKVLSGGPNRVRVTADAQTPRAFGDPNALYSRILLPWDTSVPDQYRSRPSDSRDGTTFLYNAAF